MITSDLDPKRVARAKRAFSTRRVLARDMQTIISGSVRPRSGDLVLASVYELGKHRKIEKPTGRRALMMPGDEIIVCYGNRYAPDQFEALVCDDLDICDLVAGGGIAAREVARHDRMIPPTRIQPIGLVGNAEGKPLNVADYRIAFEQAQREIKLFIVVGTAMNSGKTFTAASLIHGLKRSGYRVAGIKGTGTGSGGDMWQMQDMGADLTLDFTDAGFPGTYKCPGDAIEEGVIGLVNHAANRGCDFAILEIADGLQHAETAQLLQSEFLLQHSAGCVFAAYDSLGAAHGCKLLDSLGHKVLAISGQITRSPLAMREAEAQGIPLYTPFDIQAGAMVSAMTGLQPAEADLEARQRYLARHHQGAIASMLHSEAISDSEQEQLQALRTQGARRQRSVDFPDDWPGDEINYGA